MEVVFGFLFILVLLFIAMLPVIILFGIFGIVFKSVVAMLMFALKYLLPFGVIGLVVAKLRDRKGYFVWQEYMAHMGVALGAGLVALLIFLNIPVTPDLPEEYEVKRVTASYDAGIETRTSSTETDWLIESLVGSLNSAEYTRVLEEFIEEDENDFVYTLTLTDAEEKEYTVIFYNHKVIGVQKGKAISYYKMKDGHTVPQDLADNIFTLEKKAESEKAWVPFVEELFSSVIYDEDEQAITFVIPEVIPQGSYEIDLYVEGSREYTGGKFEPREFFIYEDEQKKDLWVPGERYSLPAEDICFSRVNIKVDFPYLEDPYKLDALTLLPEEKVYR